MEIGVGFQFLGNKKQNLKGNVETDEFKSCFLSGSNLFFSPFFYFSENYQKFPDVLEGFHAVN